MVGRAGDHEIIIGEGPVKQTWQLVSAAPISLDLRMPSGEEDRSGMADRNRGESQGKKRVTGEELRCGLLFGPVGMMWLVVVPARIQFWLRVFDRKRPTSSP